MRFIRALLPWGELKPNEGIDMDSAVVEYIRYVAKAVITFAYVGGAWLVANAPDFSSLGELSQKTWLQAGLAGLLGAGLVYSVPNGDEPS